VHPAGGRERQPIVSEKNSNGWRDLRKSATRWRMSEVFRGIGRKKAAVEIDVLGQRPGGPWAIGG
jgi:hypothetical protein